MPNASEMSRLAIMDFPNGKDRNGETRTGTLTMLNAPLTERMGTHPFQSLVPIVGITAGGFQTGTLRRRSAWE